MSTPEPGLDYYALLDIDRTADHAAIGHAVKSQRRRWVGRQNSPSVDKQREAEDRLVWIAAAEAALLNPANRQAYDMTLASMTASPAARGSAPATPSQPRRHPNAPPATVHLGHDWSSEAREALDRGDLRNAKYAGTRATDVNPRDDVAWALLARVSKANGRWDDAYVEIHRALKLRRLPAHLEDLAEIHKAQGNWAEAADAYVAAATVDPSGPRYQLAAAEVWFSQSRPDLALQILEPLYTAYPDNADVNGFLAYALSTHVDAYSSELRDGSLLFTSAVQIDRARVDLQRALSLSFPDQTLRDRLEAQLQQAEHSSSLAWVGPGSGLAWVGWLVLAWLASAIAAQVPSVGPLLSFLTLIGVIWAFIKLHRKPRWQRNARKQAPMVRRWGV